MPKGTPSMNFVKYPDNSLVARSPSFFGAYLVIKPVIHGDGAQGGSVAQIFAGNTSLGALSTCGLVAESYTPYPADSEEAKLDAIHTFKLWAEGIIIGLTTDGHGTTIYEV